MEIQILKGPPSPLDPWSKILGDRKPRSPTFFARRFRRLLLSIGLLGLLLGLLSPWRLYDWGDPMSRHWATATDEVLWRNRLGILDHLLESSYGLEAGILEKRLWKLAESRTDRSGDLTLLGLLQVRFEHGLPLPKPRREGAFTLSTLFWESLQRAKH